MTTRTRYATRLMVELARRFKEGPLRLNEVARRQQMPQKYLEQLAIPLKEAGLVRGRRGAGGGYVLARPPGDITVWEIMEAVEQGPLTPCQGDDGHDTCPRFQACPTKRVWLKIDRLIADELKKTRLSHLIDGEEGG